MNLIINEKNLFVQHRGNFVYEFKIGLTSFRQVQEFVAVAVRQPFDVLVGNEWQQINGKDIMGMFSLDYSLPVQVNMECSQEEFLQFRREASPFLL